MAAEPLHTSNIQFVWLHAGPRDASPAIRAARTTARSLDFEQACAHVAAELPAAHTAEGVWVMCRSQGRLSSNQGGQDDCTLPELRASLCERGRRAASCTWRLCPCSRGPRHASVLRQGMYAVMRLRAGARLDQPPV